MFTQFIIKDVIQGKAEWNGRGQDRTHGERSDITQLLRPPPPAQGMSMLILWEILIVQVH